jgi:fructose-specific component phosphotransferase system IIB-like protein
MNIAMKKGFKIFVFVVLGLVLIGAGIGYYLFNMPHRNVQHTASDYHVTASALVKEYLKDSKKADKKYLDEEGESKIFEVAGEVSDISEDFNGQKVVLLKKAEDKAGVSCTFTLKTNRETNALRLGQTTKIKGVIRSGANYDSDLEMYENVIIEKSSIVN